MIIIKSDRIIEPFGILLSRESTFMLMPPIQSNDEEIEDYDGEIEFAPIIKNVEYSLNGIIEHNNPLTKQQEIDDLKSKLLEYMDIQDLMFEIDPSKITYARVTRKPEFDAYPTFTKISFDLKLDPFWYSANEKSLVGSGTIFNDGTFETGLIIEIAGPVTNPSLTIGDDILTYNGSLTSGEVLVLDTLNQTSKIGTMNAMNNYNKVFPLLYPGEMNISANTNVTVKWRNKWI